MVCYFRWRQLMKEREVTVVPTKDGYDRWSEIYEEDGNPLILLEESHVARVLGNVAGLSIVDVGCGTGRHAVRLAQMGAKVTGIDFSTGMLARARSKPGADAVTFVEHDIRAAFPFDAGSFDRVLSCLVLDHVVDLPAFFAELRRVCKPDGFVVTSVMHPAMVLKGIQARFTDPSTGAEVRPESSPYQVSDYVMGAVRSGLQLLDVSEHIVDAALVSRSERARKHLGWPLLLLMKLSP
jgi:ubiquinone/menaquinone biosynthesis C-methylase UbiE